MAITRTPIVDDDGTGTTGTVLNNAWKQELYDQVDAADAALSGAMATDAELAAVNAAIRADFAAADVALDTRVDILELPGSVGAQFLGSNTTGTLHNWEPAGAGGLRKRVILQWFGSTDLIVTGLAGGAIGTSFTFTNAGPAVLYLRHHDGGSLAANRFWNTATSAPTPIGPGGSATVYYDGALWRLIQHEQGGWVTPPYSAANFTATAGTWTVEAADVTRCAYRLSGSTITYAFYLGSTTTSAAAAQLLIAPAAWGGFSPKATVIQAFLGGVAANVLCYAVVIASGAVQLNNTTGSWAVGTNNVSVYGVLVFEVN